MKRIMCLLLALVMVFSLVGVSAFADGETQDEAAAASEETADPAAEPEEDAATEEPEEDEADAEESEEVEAEDAGIMLMSSESGDTISIPVTVTGELDGIYSWNDYSEITLLDCWYTIKVFAGYDIEVTGAEVSDDDGYYYVDNEGNVYCYRFFMVSEEDYVEGMSLTVKIVTSNEEAPTAVKVTMKSASGEDTVFYALPDNTNYIELYDGYALSETDGVKIVSSGYDILYEDGQVYAWYNYSVTGEKSEVTLNVVKDTNAPSVIKITFAGDLAEIYSGSYMLSTDEYTEVWLSTIYDITSVTNAEVKYWYDENDLIIYPDEGATEIVITGTKKATSALKVTGATEQVISITRYDNETGGLVDVAEGDMLDADQELYVTLKQGYVIEECSGWSIQEDGTNIYYVDVSDIWSDGTATLNVAQGAVLAYAGDVENGLLTGSGYYSASTGRTLLLNFGACEVDTAYGYTVDVDGGEVVDTYYYCNSETGEVRAEYYVLPTEAGTMTVTIRKAEAGELPVAAKVTYTGETDALLEDTQYVIPGYTLTVETESGYVAEVSNAAEAVINDYYTWPDGATVNFTVNENATSVTVNILKVAAESKLEVVGGSDVSDEEAKKAVVNTDGTAADGEALESGANTIRVANGYEIQGVDGAVYYENGYVVDEDGNIYLEYTLVPTGNPAEVQITVGVTAAWVTVTLTNNTNRLADIYGWREKTDNGYLYLSTDAIRVYVYGENTVKVTGGKVVDSSLGSIYSNYFEIEANDGVTELSIEIISVDKLTAEQAEAGYIDSTNSGTTPGGTTPGGDKPDGTTPGGDKPDGKPDAKPDGEPGGEAPKTGDEANATLWAVL
ncbi:MAG: hypothetical protein LUH45_05410, partial [Clostridiales bacterium]|nr:hypothetical protein [Clostridiales bacterium]